MTAFNITHDYPHVVHIVESLNNQAVETWLLRMLHYASTTNRHLNWTFFCIDPQPGLRDDEAKRLGARVIHSGCMLSSGLEYFVKFRECLSLLDCDILHAHHDLMAAPYLASSYGLPIKRRIVHVHNADLGLPTPSRLKHYLLKEPFRQICMAADRVVGVSNHTLLTMIGGRKSIPQRDVVHYYGVDPSPFLEPVSSQLFRDEINVPPEAKLLLFGGRIVPEKNPLFVIDILVSMLKHCSNVFAVFAGSGGLERAVQIRAHDLGVSDHIRMLGWRHDLPRVMKCCDLFVLPRPEEPMEGLGLAVIEAQLAGLRLLLSEGIADDPLLPNAVYTRLPLHNSTAIWASAAMQLLEAQTMTTEAAVNVLEKTHFAMDFAFDDLISLHSL